LHESFLNCFSSLGTALLMVFGNDIYLQMKRNALGICESERLITVPPNIGNVSVSAEHVQKGRHQR